MISPQESGATTTYGCLGNRYYYPTAGTDRVTVTPPDNASHTYWRRRIGEEIAQQLEHLVEEPIAAGVLEATNLKPNYYDGLIHAASIARGWK